MIRVNSYSLCALSLLLGANSAESADELKLLSAMNVTMSKYGMTWQSPQIRLRVKQIAFDKRLRLTFTDIQGQTTVSEASYFGPADAGYEIWEAWSNLNSAGGYQFHVEYETAGQSFTVEDQELKLGPVFYAEQNIQQLLGIKYFYGSTISFTAAVRNIALHKKVQAHYSCDGFQTTRILSLSFQPYFMYGYGSVSSPTPEGYEIWTAQLNEVPETCPWISYFMSYDVGGQRYYDNNFGYNYEMHRAY